jgi:hypothetical protein
MTMTIAQIAANYRPQEVGLINCGSCARFLPRAGRCILVAGRISALAVCDKWSEQP